MSNIIPFKTCPVCRETFPNTPEYFSKTGKGYLTSKCKGCISIIRMAKYAANPEPAKLRAKKWREDNPERKKQQDREYAKNNPNKVAAIKRRWVANNPKKKLEASRAYRKRNPGQNNNAAAKWRNANPEKTRAIKLRRRAKERGLPNTFTHQDWVFALNYFGGYCAVCNRPPGLWHKLAADHWIPITASNSPGTVPSNIIPLCQGQSGCNNSKSHHDPEEWLIGRFGKRKAQEILTRIQTYFEVVRSRTSDGA